MKKRANLLIDFLKKIKYYNWNDDLIYSSNSCGGLRNLSLYSHQFKTR